MKRFLFGLATIPAVMGLAAAAGQGVGAEVARKQATTLANAKEIGTALLAYYVADHDDVLPAAKDMPQIKKALQPYLKNAPVWKSENPGSQLLFNLNLSHVDLRHLPAVADVPFLYESKPWPDGSRVVIYGDTHGRIEPASEWPRIQKLLNKKWPEAKAFKKGR